jgi:hypothetical protein
VVEKMKAPRSFWVMRAMIAAAMIKSERTSKGGPIKGQKKELSVEQSVSTKSMKAPVVMIDPQRMRAAAQIMLVLFLVWT